MNKSLVARLCSLLATVTLATPAASAQAVSIAEPCAPSAGLAFVCGAERPEDLAHIPGTRWLIASGFSKAAGLKLVDTGTKGMRHWYTGDHGQIGPNQKFHRTCQSAPDVSQFNTQGISLRALGDGRFTLYVVNHGGRESIEVFSIDATGIEPTLSWTGCVPLPLGLAANSVASFSDGTILATVLTHPGTTFADFVSGKNTGGVYEWKPGSEAFRLLPGTELPGNNGLETSRDDKEFYVVAFGWHAIMVYARADTTRPLRKAVAPGFMPDNVHWTGGRLIAAGMIADEPACGGSRKVIDGVADGMLCHRGYVVAQLDPASMAFSVVAYAEPHADFNGVSAAAIVGNDLWLGSYQSNRIGYRRLPSGPGTER